MKVGFIGPPAGIVGRDRRYADRRGLAKDVTLPANLLGDGPGSELVDAARRFVTATHTGDRP